LLLRAANASGDRSNRIEETAADEEAVLVEIELEQIEYVIASGRIVALEGAGFKLLEAGTKHWGIGFKNHLRESRINSGNAHT
jgi:hypothetical protein